MADFTEYITLMMGLYVVQFNDLLLICGEQTGILTGTRYKTKMNIELHNAQVRMLIIIRLYDVIPILSLWDVIPIHINP